MYPLPYDRQRWALARILTAPAFGLGAGPWSVQPMWSKKRKGYGFELIDLTRACLPAIGEATFQYRYGLIDGDVIGKQDAPIVARRIAGSPWDPALDAATAPDLRGYEVRIQLAEPVAQGVTPAWFTAWWGQVEYQSDTIWPGAAYPAGVRTYRCVDGFARAKRWPVDRHTTYGGSYWYVNVEGHPGYNVGPDGRIAGNKDTNAVTSIPSTEQNLNPAIKEMIAAGDTRYKIHTHQGRAGALLFSAQESLEDAMRKTRGLGDPLFSFYGDTLWLEDQIAIPVNQGDTAWDLVARVCSRGRGRGNVFIDWADDSAAPTGPLTVRLRILPQSYANVSITTPATVLSSSALLAAASADLATAPSDPVKIAAYNAALDAYNTAITGTYLPGAASTASGRIASTVTVDLIGDHRVVAEDTQLGDRFLHVADAVETTSELMQLLMTMSYYDGLDGTVSQRWLASREATFAALSATNRTDESWWPLWNLHGLPDAWGGMAKDHNGGNAYACDFACNDQGNLTSSQTAGVKITSPILCRIMPDLPLYEGYDYTTSSPKRKIGDQTSFDETGRPARRAPFVLFRTSVDRYKTGDQVTNGRSVSVQVRGRDILVYDHGDKSNGLRLIGNPGTSGLGSVYFLSQLGVTVGIELPHRLRMKSLRAGVIAPRRTVSIRIPDLHLWLAHSGAIWELNESTLNSSGSTPRRGAGGGASALPGILRDDRDALARIHAMACAWYLSPRLTAHWTLRACGLLPNFITQDRAGTGTTTVNYPTLGAVVTDFKAGGQIYSLNTPVTMIHYDHSNGRTTFETDWQELDTAP